MERELSGQRCGCGCGQQTYTAIKTNRKAGWVKGDPLRYVHGHAPKNTAGLRPGGNRTEGVGPNPGGLCLCGCGRPAPLARSSVASRGTVNGKPVSYIRGHRHRLRVEWVEDRETGCWIWQGQPGSHGRGQKMLKRGQNVLAYRWVYETHKGPIPAALELHHTCETPMCVNPDHLEPLTPKAHADRHRS